MTATPTQLPPTRQIRRKVLLNLKCLFWCIHELRQQYNLNLTLHTLELGRLHPDLEDSHLGDNLSFLMETFEGEDLVRLRHALGRIFDSRASIDVGDKHFEVGHYIQAIGSFGPIAEASYGIICSVTPELRALFYLEGGHTMESAFAPSDARVIFGTYIG